VHRKMYHTACLAFPPARLTAIERKSCLWPS
jgi:hypothetical protein